MFGVSMGTIHWLQLAEDAWAIEWDSLTQLESWFELKIYLLHIKINIYSHFDFQLQ